MVLTCAPSRIRTCGLLLRSNPGAHAVAISGDAGHVRGGTRCCSPSYLVIANADTAWTVSQAVASSLLIVPEPSAPVPQAVTARPAPCFACRPAAGDGLRRRRESNYARRWACSSSSRYLAACTTRPGFGSARGRFHIGHTGSLGDSQNEWVTGRLLL